MMKSFFKKLAFVMALAMVVSAMAPAASAKAADALGICFQEDTTWTAQPAYEFTVGDPAKDFKFSGADTDWKDYTWTWTSDNDAVATVDSKSGLVTPVAKGEAVITVSNNGEGEKFRTGSIKITVVEPVVLPEYEVVQTAGDKVTVTWADAANATADVTLYKIYNLTSGVVDVKWPCEVTLKDGVATVDAFVDFEDGDKYVLKFGDVAHEFVAYVGEVDKIVVVPKDVKTNGTTLYACAEEPYRPIRFDVEFITEGGIKVAQPADTSIYYEVIDADDAVQIDNEGACSYITAVGAAAVVKAIYYYTDANGEAKELYDEFVIVGEEIPVAKFGGVVDYAVVAKDTKVADAKWSKAELIYGEEAYVALKFADTLTGVYYTDTTLALDATKETKFENVVSDDVVIANSEFGTISYMSSDETKLLVGANDGKLTAIGTDGTAVVIVKLTTTDASGNENTKNIYAFEVALKGERKADKVNATGTTVLVLDNAEGALAQSGKLTFTVVDQYGNPWTEWTNATITTTTKDAPALTITQDENADGVKLNTGTVVVNGARFADVVKQAKTSVTYTIDVDGAKAIATVTLKNPPVVVDEENDTTTVKTSGYLVEATGTDVDGSKPGTIEATIKAYETWTSNGVKYKVGYVNPSKFVAYTHNDGKFWSNNAVELPVGSIVVMVQKPNNEYIVPTINASTGAITVPVATVNNGEKLNIAATGTYKVTLYKVTAATKKTDNTYKIDKLEQTYTTFEVNNKCKNMTVSFAPNQALTSNSGTIEQVIVDLATFKLGGTETDVTADMIKAYGVYNDSADKYYVKEIVVKTPVGTTGAYFEETLKVGLTFTVPGMPDAE